ncbi:MAG: lipoyl domain-containing protein [Gemmataceae bacterium]|nr:lipoyl domain-containing protein [Gemmataceae bacterium]
MPRVPITLPDLGTARATLSLWYVRPGDRVFEGDRVAEVLIPGATVDVPAPATGTLADRGALSGDPLTTRQVLGVIDVE